MGFLYFFPFSHSNKVLANRVSGHSTQIDKKQMGEQEQGIFSIQEDGVNKYLLGG